MLDNEYSPTPWTKHIAEKDMSFGEVEVNALIKDYVDKIIK